MKSGRYWDGVFGFALATLICPAAFGQVSLTPDRRPFLTSDQLTAVVETDAAAAAIVSEGLAHFLSVFPDKSKAVIGAQIPENWLPETPGVQFTRLTDDAARAHLEQCGRLLFVNSLQSARDTATIAIAEGNRCSVGGMDVRFIRSPNGWRRDTGGVAGGSFHGATAHCQCK